VGPTQWSAHESRGVRRLVGTLVVVPTFNEAGNLPRLLSEVHVVAPAAHVLVVDDNSPDGTGSLAESLECSDDRIFVLRRPRKLGLGTAYIAGFRWALDTIRPSIRNVAPTACCSKFKPWVLIVEPSRATARSRRLPRSMRSGDVRSLMCRAISTEPRASAASGRATALRKPRPRRRPSWCKGGPRGGARRRSSQRWLRAIAGGSPRAIGQTPRIAVSTPQIPGSLT